MKKIVLIILLLTSTLLAYAQPMPPKEENSIPEVKIQKIKIIDEYEYTYYGARLEPYSTRTQTTPFAGTIVNVFVVEGQKVNKGSALFSISRTTQASTGDYVPLTVYAFSSGVISNINIENNEEVGANTNAVSIADISSFKAILLVSDKDIPDLSVGMKCYYVSDSNIFGTIKQIPIIPDSSTGLFPVELSFNVKPGLFAGKFLSLMIPVKPLSGAYVPTSAIISRYGKKFIYTIKDDIAHLTEITPLKIDSKNSLINGVSNGDLVAISNSFLLAEGKKVKIVTE